MSLGSTLKEARERKGLTIAQVAEQTRMIHQLVEEIEQDDFHRISAAVYGRGFVKLLAECVGEEPGPLVQEFTEIYSGLRRPGVRTRPVQTPAENPEVEEPEDRNAPPPRPKVRAVVLADDEESAAPVESPKSEVESPATAPVESPKSEVESPAATPVESPAAEPVESPKPEVESPAAAPVESLKSEVETPAAAPVESPKPEVESPAAVPVESPKSEVESPAAVPVASPKPEVESLVTAPVASPKSEVESPAETIASDAAEEQADSSLLGELFDFSFRRRRAGNESESVKVQEDIRDEPHIQISLPQPARSWDDAPLGESGLFTNLLRYLNIRVVAAVLGGLVLLSAIVFGVVVKRHSKPEAATDTPTVSQTAPISEPEPEPQPKPAPAELSTRTPAPAPAPTRTPAPTPAPAPTRTPTPTPTPTADGKSVYADNLIPPPDSYVE